ncbi:membrane protease subunit, stomatin/prohibitin [Beggiatoa alba B18LD]|uniref:Membrane protease subunit, stomatin/prohibitin n=1 Tax=Beggiatoa alba B18LD TaxID=395493 RepID=I3CFQ5_9GAMM|nr:SPFH domain-containing protein [Beggiatoa alba]EIJ42448.1 membrane protease subunit, stomatin/prohibitin [Beggiatoa alba B18LD]
MNSKLPATSGFISQIKTGIGWLIGLIISLVAISILMPLLLKIETVNGNQVGVLETWTGGVQVEPYPARTYFLFPGFSQTMFTYPLSLQVFVMNDKAYNQEFAEGREKDSYLVQSSEGQDMHISLNVQWRIDAAKVVDIHRTVRDNIEEKMLRPVVMRVVKDEATKRTAIEAYSGQGLVKLQTDIFTALVDERGELRSRGVIVENFVIEGIRLDPKYIGEITERQVATQRRLKADEQTKAAQSEALRAEAEAQADLKRRVVEAERDKQVGILNAEKESQQSMLAAEASKRQVVLHAEAQQQKLVLEATGTRDARILEAEGIIAIGKSEAEAQRLKLSAFAVEGSDSYVKVEIAKSLASAHQNVKGYLPNDMNVYTLGNNFMDAIESIVGRQAYAGESATQQPAQ